MMFANPKWFKRRKYTGWGISPRTWQGWCYLAIWLGLLVSTTYVMDLFQLNSLFKLGLICVFIIIMGIDVVDIVRKMQLDEREKQHEAFAERNSCWTIIMVLALGLCYQVVISVINNRIDIDPFIVSSLIIGTIVKAFSNWYYLDK
jgi:hypothetical protein